MTGKLPFKKDHLLIAGSVLLLLISYRVALKPTFEAWTQYQNLLKQQEGNYAVNTSGYQERKMINMDHILQRYRVDTLTFRNKVINYMALLAEKEGVKLVSMPGEDFIYAAETTTIQQLNFEGNYFSLTRLLYQIEKTEGIGTIRSVSFIRNLVHGSETDGKVSLPLIIIANKKFL